MYKKDYSFIRLLTDFEKSKSEIFIDSEHVYRNNIVLHPSERYLQITNSQIDIAFDDSYKVEIIDCIGNILLDITDKVYINEFQDIKGIYQIAFEIAPINQDFYLQDVYFKFSHLDSDLVLYSNPINITAENENETFRLDYKSYQYYQGISYDRAQFYQSIRLKGYLNGVAPVEESEIYTQLDGKIRKSRVIQSFDSMLKVDFCDVFTMERLSVALNSQVVYLNGSRFTNKEAITVGEREGKSNIFQLDFKGQFNEDDTINETYQIASQLEIVQLTPKGNYTLDSLPLTGLAQFNGVITYGSGYLYLFDYNTEALLHTITINISVNSFDFTLPALGLGDYYFNFNDGLIFNSLGLTTNILDKETWKFSIKTGDYNKLQYNIQYFTN